MLKGQELLAKVKELGETDRGTLIRECGYVATTKAGKPRLMLEAFYEALTEAKGVKLPPPAKAKGGGKKLSYTVKLSKTGLCPVAGGYTKQIGGGPGDTFSIEVVGDAIVMRKALVGSTTATPIEQADSTASPVVTYDSEPTPVGAGTPF